MNLKVAVFTKRFAEPCLLCLKAKNCLQREGVRYVERPIEGQDVTVENISDFSWFGWVDMLPLVVVYDKDDADKVYLKANGHDVRKGFTKIARRIKNLLTTGVDSVE